MSATTIDKPPTARQRKILAFLWKYWREHGYPPSLRDVCGAFDFASPNGVMCHFRALEKRGLIRRPTGGMSRAWMPVPRDGLCPCCRRPMPAEGGA